MKKSNDFTTASLPLVLSVEEAAAVLRIGRGAAYALVRAGTLRCIRVGRIIRIPRSAIEEFIGSIA